MQASLSQLHRQNLLVAGLVTYDFKRRSCKKNEALRNQPICAKASKKCLVGIIQFLQCRINKNSGNKIQSNLRGWKKKELINDSLFFLSAYIQRDQVKKNSCRIYFFKSQSTIISVIV